MPTPTRTQTAAIASGDPEALAEFYCQWFGFVFDEARRLTKRDEAFCLDMVQNTMMRVIRSIKPLDHESAVAQWLRSAVRSCCVDRLRQEQRRVRRELACSRSPKSSSHEDQQSSHDQADWLARELARLEPERSNLLRLRFGLGWTLQRIGVAVGMNTGAVDGRINRTLAELRAKAAEELHE